MWWAVLPWLRHRGQAGVPHRPTLVPSTPKPMKGGVVEGLWLLVFARLHAAPEAACWESAFSVMASFF